MRKRWLAVLVALSTIAALAALPHLRAKSSPPPESRPLSISSNDYVLSALVYIAADRGYFAKHGLKVTLRETPAGKISIRDLLAGTTDLAVAADIPVMFSIMSGEPLIVLASLGESDGDHGVVARRNHGIAGVADLKGKKVGLSLGTSGHYYFDRMLLTAGIPVNSVQIVNASPDRLVPLLAEGKVDAIGSWDPVLTEAAASLGNEAVRLSPPGLHTLIWNLLATREFTARNPQTIAAVLQSLLDAQYYLRDHPTEAHDIVARQIGLDRAALDRIWGGYHPRLMLEQSLLMTLDDESRWAVARGLTARPSTMPNFLDYVDFRYLERLAPAAVTIVR